jgi:hypothetical protein
MSATFETDVPPPTQRLPQAAAVLLILHAVFVITRAIQIWGVAPAPTLLVAGLLSLPLAIGLWNRARWAWWGTLIVLLFMLAQQALGAFVLLVTPEGRSVLLYLFTTPSLALGWTALEFLILILLLFPSSRAAVRRRAGA